MKIPEPFGLAVVQKDLLRNKIHFPKSCNVFSSNPFLWVHRKAKLIAK